MTTSTIAMYFALSNHGSRSSRAAAPLVLRAAAGWCGERDGVCAAGGPRVVAMLTHPGLPQPPGGHPARRPPACRAQASRLRGVAAAVRSDARVLVGRDALHCVA